MRASLRPLVPTVALLLAMACGGGANANRQQPGAQEGGTALAAGDIAVSTSGKYVAFAHATELAIGWVGTGRLDLLDVQEPSRLAFQHVGQGVLVASGADQRVHAIEPSTRLELWQGDVTDAGASSFGIDVTEDDAYVVTYGEALVEVLDGATGALAWRHETERAIVDVDIVGDRVVIVEAHEWVDGAPVTRVDVLALQDGVGDAFEVPNCASALEVLPNAATGFIAPTSCNEDPVSVLDLTAGSEGFVKNLPGFGPVAVAPDGWTVVAFYSRSQADTALFEDPSLIPADTTAEYHLMILDGATLAFELLEYGDDLPRYAVSPDGQVVLVDTASLEGAVELLDLTTRTWRTVDGPPLYLDDFALSGDGADAYVLHGEARGDPGLLHLDLAAATSAPMDAGFLPTNLNLSPTDDTLFLRESATRICVFDVAEEACAQWLDTSTLDETATAP